MLAIRFPVSEALPMCSPDSFCFYSLDLSDHVAALFVMLPMLSLGILYWYGRPQPRRTAYLLATGLQSLRSSSAASSLWCESSHALMTETYKPAGKGNGVRLVWAADGVGWPREGLMNEAVMRCQYLTEDGRALGDIPQNVWRLPTVEEAVRSMSRRGVNSGGTWNEQTRTATYRVRPDKESPLWNVRSQVIYCGRQLKLIASVLTSLSTMERYGRGARHSLRRR